MAVQSKERLNELLEKYRLTGDMNVRNEIVLMYMDLVKMIAVSMRNIYTGYAESDDIINEGVIALMAAIDGFDPEKNVKFETYAGIRIKGAVIDYLRKLAEFRERSESCRNSLTIILQDLIPSCAVLRQTRSLRRV